LRLIAKRLPHWPARAALAATMLAGAAVAAAGQGPEAASPPPATAATAAAAAAAAPRDVAEISRNLWWNQPRVVERLQLSPPQRAAMDRVFADHLAARRAARQTLRAGSEGPDPFRVALAAADLEAARQAVEERSARAAAEATAVQRMTLSILELLEPEQLARVRSEIPQLLERSWFLQAGGDGPRRRPLPRRSPPRWTAPPPAAAEPPPQGGGGPGD
jgi:LTXXQ motif family protein